MTVKASFAALVLALLSAWPARARAAATYPFPQNKPQPVACYYPSYLNSDVQFVYSDWLAQQVTSAGAGGYRRVRRHGDPTLQADSTVSEGIGYGMIIAVYMNDQSLFDDLWRYYNLHLDGNGLMHWYISADGATILGSGAASDADQDAAWALVMASYQWGTSSYGSSYATMANALITKLYNVYVDGTSKVFGPWAGAGNTINVSYFDPASYRLFAQFTGNSNWLLVIDACYNALFASLKAANGNANNGLVPAWSNGAGDPVPGFGGAPVHFQYDSCRTPFRIGKDWYFYGDTRAKQYLDKINSFYVPIGADNITDGYDLNGAERPQYDTLGNGDTGQSAAFLSPAMMGAMDVPGQSAFVQTAYDNIKTNTLLIGGPYYDQCWTVMGMLWASGNYLNYAPTPTPTPTVDACQTRIKVNCAGPALGGYSADKAYAAGGWGYVTGFAGAVGTSGGPVTGDPNGGLYLDERYDSAANSEVRYSFTLPNGPATVTLSWAETYFNSAGQRQMDVFVGGTQVENNLDVWSAAGGKNKALIRNYSTTVSGGVLTLRFVSVAANATIHAIEVVSGSLCSPTVSPTRTPQVSATATPTRTPSFSPSPSFTVSPTPTASPTPYPTPDACSWVQRVNCGGTAFTGAGSLTWAADKAYSAGSYGYVSFAAGAAGTSAGPIANTTDDALFMAERYGNPVRYRFDLPNGIYQVRVRLAETYFASAGQRNYSLTANGTTILNSVDLYTWAGGLNVARDHTFFVTVATGNLQLESFSSNNNGTFQAIEVIGTSGCTATPTPAFTQTVSPTRSASASATRTPSPSVTRTATPTGTASASPSATPTESPTSSATASPSATRSASPSVTPSATRSSTASPSVTMSPTPQPGSPTDSPTLSATRSATPTVTPSATRTASITASPSATESVTPSATRSASPSPSATPSATPSRTLTASPTLSFSMTRSPTPSESPSITETATPPPPGSSPTPTPTRSPSFSVTPTVTRTETPSATPSATPTETRTATPTASVTLTPTGTATPTDLPSPSATATSTALPTAAPSATPSPVDSATATLTPTRSATRTATPTGTLTATLSPVLSATPTLTDAPTALPSGEAPVIEEHRAWPLPVRPQGAWVSVRLRGNASLLRVTLYSVNWARIDSRFAPGAGPGWTRVALPSAFWQDLASGTYFYVVEAQDGGAWHPADKPGRLVFIR